METRFCKNHGDQPIDKYRWVGKYLRCKECFNAKRRSDGTYANNLLWRKRHPEHGPKYKLSYSRQLKIDVFSHYGIGQIKCSSCGISELEKLALDHIKDDGAEFRRKYKMSGGKFYAWLRANKYPDVGLQILCHNCNIIKRDSKPRSFKWEKKYKRRDMVKILCLQKYSSSDVPICARCKISDDRVLTIDHINDDGGEFRKTHGMKGGDGFYLFLKKHNYPDIGLQVLCFNCNIAKMILQRRSKLV